MSKISGPSHIVVDGSNIATEGRSRPSLAQLNEAVTSFMGDHPNAAVTVVVDATFGHRIDPSERSEFDEAVANNELVAPPAGAIGRGDAFVLTIADKAGATILSNDSFQEFHADYEWLFDEGRLVGGKPVPHVGWVFVARTPVRGPVSRKVTKQAKKGSGSVKAAGRPSKEASQPMPVPTAPPPGRATVPEAPAPATARGPKGSPSNDLMPFLDFVEHHPVGTSCSGVVESYSSHGAYLRVGEVAVYLPLRMMADPAPRSARSVLTLGETVTVVVTAITAAKRSIDVAMPEMAGSVASSAESAVEPVKTPAKNAPTKKAAAKKAPARKAAAKKAAAKKSVGTKDAAPAKKAAAKKAAVKATGTKATATTAVPATPGASKKAPAKKAPARKAPAKSAAAKKTPAKKAPAKKSAAKKVAAQKASS